MLHSIGVWNFLAHLQWVTRSDCSKHPLWLSYCIVTQYLRLEYGCATEVVAIDAASTACDVYVQDYLY